MKSSVSVLRAPSNAYKKPPTPEEIQTAVAAAAAAAGGKGTALPSANKGYAAAVVAWVATVVGAARARASETFALVQQTAATTATTVEERIVSFKAMAMGRIASVERSVEEVRKTFHARYLVAVASAREQSAKVVDLAARMKETASEKCTHVAANAIDALAGAKRKVLSCVPASVMVRLDTAYVASAARAKAVRALAARTASEAAEKAVRAKATVLGFVATKVGALRELVASAKVRYATVVGKVSASLALAEAKLVAILEETRATASSAAARVWDRVPSSIRARAAAFKESAAAKAAAAGNQAGAVWKYASEDPKAQTAAKAAAGGAAAGGASGFAVGGTVGAVVGVIPALFTLGLSIPLGAAIGSGIGFGCGAAAGGAAGLASGAVYANTEEMKRSVSKCRDHVKVQAAYIQDKASVSVSAATRRLRNGGA